MVRKLIDWSVANPLLVLLLTTALIIGGGYAFTRINIEAYPDPAPAIIEVVAQYPGASAEEVERQVTIPLEVGLAGMPGLETTRSKSLFGLAHVRNQFSYERDYEHAKQDVFNRLSSINLPEGVVPQISPASPIGEILRYTLHNPINPKTGKPVYTLNDLKAVQDYVVQRDLLRVPRVAGVTGVGGSVKRYEVQPDPYELARYNITLGQIQDALGSSNKNGSGDNLTTGKQQNVVVRTLGLIGHGQDPQQMVLGMSDPVAAEKVLRAEEARRLREIRQVVVASVNNVPIRIDQLVDGGPLLNADGTPRVDDRALSQRGVVVSFVTRQGRVAISRPKKDAEGHPLYREDGGFQWDDEDDVVQGVVLLRKGQESLPALHAVMARIEELNKPGHMLPGVQIVPYYNRTTLIDRTTDTVQENLLVGMGLVTAILLMFLGNVRAAVIVAINIPLALLFAFGILYARGRSANLLSIGAVDFGIIVDSTVIVVESIYRNLTTHGAPQAVEPGVRDTAIVQTLDEPAGVPSIRRSELHIPTLGERIATAVGEVQRSLFFATIVMVCALLPLFTMQGPEGQIFGPMADTYAFALAGALLLSMTISPVLCLLLFRNLQPKRDNKLVRGLKWLFAAQLALVLRFRLAALVAFVGVLVYTGAVAANMGREFMPELEEGSLLIRGTFPVNVSMDEVASRSRQLRAVLRGFPEMAAISSTIGRPDDGTDPTGYYNLESSIPLRSADDWPSIPKYGRPRRKAELVHDLNEALDHEFENTVDWDISQIIRDNVLESLSGVKGENSIKLFGPDLATLEETAFHIKEVLGTIPGAVNAGVFRVQGQTNLEFPVDRQKCAFWKVSTADIQDLVETAVGGKTITQILEGEKRFSLVARLPMRFRGDETSILAIPVPVKNSRTAGSPLLASPTPVTGAAIGLSPTGTMLPPASPTGSTFNPGASFTSAPTRLLGQLVTPLDDKGRQDEKGSYLRRGASTIYREQGQRFIAVKFEVRGRDLASTVAEARSKVDSLLSAPYRAEWSGEFKQMEAAEARLARMFGISLVLIALLLYLAFHSFLDAGVVFANVLAMVVGGIWAIKLAGLNFNISAGVGFISVLGVAVMNGLLFVSVFNSLRAHHVELGEALRKGTTQLVRPVVMTALAAILGLLPAALSTKMGSESQRPLAVVVVGGMLSTIVCLVLVPVLYSFYGSRTPPAGAGDMAH